MKHSLYLSAFALFAVSVTACNENKKAKNYNEKTLVDAGAITFIKQADEAGITEIRAAQVAQSKSNNARVVNFAKMMINDHTAMGNSLKELAKNKFVTIKAASDTLSLSHQQMIDEISKLSGSAFDKAYMGMMVTDHGKVIDLFRSVDNNTNRAIQKFAEQNLPKLLTHLDSAKAINGSL